MYTDRKNGTSFVDHLCHVCLVFVLLSRLFIAGLWSPAGKSTRDKPFSNWYFNKSRIQGENLASCLVYCPSKGDGYDKSFQKLSFTLDLTYLCDILKEFRALMKQT